MATFKLELTGAEADALLQILNASKISSTAARIVASIQNKFDESADVYNADLKKEKSSSSPEAPDGETPRPKGDKGGEVSS